MSAGAGEHTASQDNWPVFLFASSNSGKLAEVRGVAVRFGLRVASPADLTVAGCTDFGFESPLPMLGEVEEPADTYRENALLKAQAYFAWARIPVLADDTGIEISALGGRPGVRSARYAGELSSAKRNIEKVLSELEGKVDRGAQFLCSLCAVSDSFGPLYQEGTISGRILESPQGSGGFGYDGIFVPEGYQHSMAELKDPRSLRYAPDLKTHRVLACEALLPKLHRFLTDAAPRTGQ